jgi:xylulokinase
MSLLGIDVGTTGCKALAFDAEGRRLAFAYREYATLHPGPGQAELDSEAVWRKVRECIAEVAAATAHDPVRALCVSSMGEAMTPVSEDRRILGHSILCSDVRGGEYADVLRQRMGQDAFYRLNPNIITAAYSMPKLAWLRDHQPDLYRSAHRFLLWSDLVGYLLGAAPMTSYSHANRTLLFDIHAERWSDTLLQICGIERDILPDVVPSGTIAGHVSDLVAGELGLPKRVAIVVGGHDQCCNALGAGVILAGTAVCGIGTFECYAPAFEMPADPLVMLRTGLNIEHHVVPGLYVTFAYNQSGSLVRWFRDTFAAEARNRAEADGLDVYDLLTAEMPAEPTRLLVLPYFEPTGPPDYVDDAAGALVGLVPTTTRGEILKAIMECATLYFVDLLDALRALGLGVSEFTATGGGAKSDAWLQIKADVFGVPFIRPRETESGALGAAMLAGIATGVFRDHRQAVDACVRRARIFMPDLDRHARYREKAAAYGRLYPALRETLADPRR